MIVNVKRKELLMQAKKVARAAPSAHSVKELSGILLEADERTGVIRMTSTNLEVSIRSTMPAAVEKEGSTVIDARLFLSILERLPLDDVYMELKENGQLNFSSGNARFFIAVMAGENYPRVDIPYPGDTVSVKGLRTLIAGSVFAAAAVDSGKPALSCVNLVFNENGVRAIGCDGTCAVQVKGDPECRGGISLLVPAASLKLLASLAEDSDVYEVGVTGSGGVSKSVIFSDGTTMFSARLIAAEYLDTDILFGRLVPEATARVDADKLRKALENVSSFATPGNRIEFTFGDNGLILRCESESGNAAHALDAEIVLATDETYYYIPKNLMGCARALKGNVTLNFTKDKMLEIQAENMRFFQLATRPAPEIKPKKEPRKKAAA